jgi:F-type H+-transporting ATPase subunit delta
MSVARTYASALLSVLPVDEGARDHAEANLRDLAAALDARADLRAALMGPLTTAPEKLALLGELLRRLSCGPMVTRFVELAMRKRRLGALQEIATAFRAARVEAEGGVLGALESADPLSDSDLADLSRAFGQKLGRKVSLTPKVNPALLAGVKVTVLGTTYDGSLQNQLSRLKNKLVESSLRNH